MPNGEKLPDVGELPWLVRDLRDRVAAIEEVKPELMAYQLNDVLKELRALKRVGIGLIISLVLAFVTFSFMILALAGGKP